MKNQKGSRVIKWAVLSLMLALTLASRYVFAQTQYAYVPISSGPSSVVQIQTSTGGQISVPLTPLRQPLGVALTDDNASAFVTYSAGSASDPATVRIDNLPCGGQNPCIATNIPNTYQKFALHVVTTPLLAVGASTCRYAYFTSGGDVVSVLNACDNSYLPPIALPSNPFNTNPPPSAPRSFGIALANDPSNPNFIPEIWVSDQNINLDRPFVYVIDPFSNTVTDVIQFPPGLAGTVTPRHLAVAYISSTEYRVYVGDGTFNNKAVWVIKGTIGAGGTTHQLMGSVTWNAGDFCDLANNATWAIAVNSTNSTAYVTVPGIHNRLYTINIANNTTGCVPTSPTPWPDPLTLSNARGIAWLADGRAYVNNDSLNKVTVIQQNPNATPGSISVTGFNQWIAVTSPNPSGSFVRRR